MKIHRICHCFTRSLRRRWVSTSGLLTLSATTLALTFDAGTALAQKALGIDVSHYDGTVTWSSVKNAGYLFAWAKANEGTTITDAYFSSDISGAKAAGIPIGAYDFAHPELNSPVAEADYFWSVAGSTIVNDGLTMQPVLDFETFSGVTGASSYADWANKWCNEVISKAAANGVTVHPILYASRCNYGEFNSSVAAWTNWVASYNGQNPQTGNPWSTCSSDDWWGGTSWTFWQYSETGTVPGISGSEVDLDVFNGTMAQLTATQIVGAGGTNVPAQVPIPDYTYAGIDENGVMQIFLPDAINLLETDFQNAPSGAWAGWSDLGTQTCAEQPVVGYNADGRVQVFVRGSDNALWTTWETVVNGATNNNWYAWTSLGGNFVGNPAVGYHTSDAIQVFVRSTSNTVAMIEQTAPNGSWTNWTDMGGNCYSDPCVGYNADRTMQLFTRSSTNTVQSNFELTQTTWFGWRDYGGSCYSRPAVGVLGDGTMQIFVRSASNTVKVLSQTGPSGNWGPWSDLGGNCYGDVVLGFNANGTMQLFTPTVSNTIASNFKQGTVSNSVWFGWFDLGGTCQSSLTLGYTPDWRMQLYMRDPNYVVQSDWQTSPNGSWSGWSSLGGNTPLVSIITQPTNQTANVGQNVTFSVLAANALTYRWTYNTTNISGATASSYTINNVQAGNAGNYAVIVGNNAGSVTSATATLTIGNSPPTITTQPSNQTVAQGQNATFTVVASGTAPLSYQWKFNAVNLSGATASSYTVTAAQPGNAGTYAVGITNVAGNVTSSNATLTVNVPPGITTQPSNQTVTQGQNATFTVVASGTAPLSYQWKFNAVNLSGATASSYTVTAAQPGNAGTYAVGITNVAGNVTSSNATLTVNVPPVISTQPSNQTVTQGQNATFTVVASGTAPLTYQWTFNAVNISGATASSYTVTAAQPGNAGTYAVGITNVAGNVTSSNAT